MGTDATVSIGLDSSELQSGANKAQGIVKRMQSNIIGAASKIGAAFAFVGGAGALKGITDELDRTAKLAQQLGVSGESLQRVGLIAKQNGADLDNLVEVLLELDLKFHDAANGGTEAEAALRNMGISAKDFVGLSLEQRLVELAKAFQKVNQNGNATPALMTLLGDESKELVPLLRSNITEMERMASTTVVGEAQLAAITDFKAQIVGMAEATKATTGNIIGDFLRLGKVQADVIKNLFSGGGLGSIQKAFDDDFMKSVEAQYKANPTQKGPVSGGDPEAKKRADELARAAARAKEIFQIETGILELNNVGTRAAAKRAAEMEKALKISMLQEQVMKQQNVTAEEALAIATKRVNAETPKSGKIQGFKQSDNNLNPFRGLDGNRNEGPSAWDKLQETTGAVDKLKVGRSPFDALKGRGEARAPIVADTKNLDAFKKGSNTFDILSKAGTPIDTKAAANAAETPLPKAGGGDLMAKAVEFLKTIAEAVK